MGEFSRLTLLLDGVSRPGRNCCCRGERLLLNASEYASDGDDSASGEKAAGGTAPGGRDGNAFSTPGAGPLELFEGAWGRGAPFAFFRRRAMRLSWQLMQKIPCDVRA
jgi:hypothetical protein